MNDNDAVRAGVCLALSVFGAAFAIALAFAHLHVMAALTIAFCAVAIVASLLTFVLLARGPKV